MARKPKTTYFEKTETETKPENVLEGFEVSSLAEMPAEELSESLPISEFFEQAKVDAVGTEADILVAKNTPLGSFCIKKPARTTERSIYNEGIIAESERHFEAYQMVNEARKRGVNTAKVPSPLFSIKDKDTGSEWILMEYINGKTLWRVILEELIKTRKEHEMKGYKQKHLLEMDDEELSEAVLDIFNIQRSLPPLKQLSSLIGYLKNVKFIKSEFFDALKNTVKLLNENGFYHRDLHPRNIMFTENEAWMIDFGYSLYDPEKKEETPYEESKYGDNLSFSPDNGILELIKHFTEISDEQKEIEKQKLAAEETREVEKRINFLVKRGKSKINDILKSSLEEEYDNETFIDNLTSDPVLRTEIIKAVTTNDIDKLKSYAKMIAFLEYERYESTDAAEEYLKNIIKQIREKPEILLNHMHNAIKSITR
jgi:tRNA A-37 threonylcarbamoyl transferase component Bud32